ncbi:hypothetical protein AA0119_g10668 [Alternaria tenuissima]|uniref:Enoyl-CoA hydratase n=1 Tax=Alternaria tenuissima TaxID=119927 RepID=A0A4Q4P5Q7_9PLEO|nr:ClpP/crotonase [Alternaria alternata]RYN36354.1 hypothetical protein AA0115_g1874 [Alternaria tenuissima]RYN68686.1 hypothetical protein AA0118_g932 [Alternaria tenuissima]RYN91219.1 hypothetical protein AA0119_g10668 [Alternaria tenuissima]RYO09987.1 hypothetical protein AA0121_g10727 [Alternaria tenuissima]
MNFSWQSICLTAFGIFSAARALELPEYAGLKTSLNNSILEVTLHNSKSLRNLWDQDTQDGLTDLVGRLQKDNETKVVIFKSDVPRYFMGHLDLTLPNLPEVVPAFSRLIYNISQLPQVTIGAVEGRARGAGNELLVSLDMRFAVKNDTLFGQPEVGSGTIPGGGGSQFLPGLIGRGLAMEYILSANDINAVDAERIGWINKAFDSSAEMYKYIDGITTRFALFPQGGLSAGKTAINRRTTPTLEDLQGDVSLFLERIEDPIVQELTAKGSAGNETSAFELELNLGENILTLYQ